jgi:uncharacterized protein YjdB
MKTSVLPNLRGKITNANGVKIEITKAINQAITYAKRSGVGYSAVSADVLALFEAAKVQMRSWVRASSIAVSPATATKAAAATQQIAVTATFPDTGTAVVTADPRTVYTTSDATKATVNAAGLVTAVATGSATITATFHGRTSTLVLTIS